MDITRDSRDIAVSATEAIDGRGVDERAESLYGGIYWNTYRGHNRGGLTGLALGAIIGAAAGLVALTFVGLGVVGLGVIASLAGTGAIMGWDALGSAGAASAARAAGLAEKHARLNDPVYRDDPVGATNDRLMVDGRAHHTEFPEDRDKGKFFYWKSGLVGAAAAGAVGVMMGFAGEAFFPAAFTGLMAIPMAAALGPVGLMLVIGALGGATFGIERSVFKSIHNETDSLFNGQLRGGREGPDLGQDQFASRENAQELLQHRLRRQEETIHLQKEYGRKIFQGSINGYVRGMAGGAAVGVLSGLAVGLVALGAVALIAASGGALLPGLAASIAASGGVGALAQVILGGFTAAGGLAGMHIFSETGTQAGAEATARAIDEEFKRNRMLKERGLPVPVFHPSEPEWFRGRAALATGIAGAGLGLLLAPVIAPHILVFAAGSALASSVSAAVCGTVGAIFGGAGSSLLKQLSNDADWIYEKSYFRYDRDLQSRPEPVAEQPGPAIAPAPEDVPATTRLIAPDAPRSLADRVSAPAGQGYGQAVLNQKQAAAQNGIAIGV